MPTTVTVTEVVPFFYVADIEASLRFYVDGLGFQKTNEWIVDGRIRWCWLRLGAASHMLQERAAHDRPATPGEGVSLNYQCDDALALYAEFTARGLTVSPRPFVGNGNWVVTLRDPDGYKLHFHSRTDAPEECELP